MHFCCYYFDDDEQITKLLDCANEDEIELHLHAFQVRIEFVLHIVVRNRFVFRSEKKRSSFRRFRN